MIDPKQKQILKWTAISVGIVSICLVLSGGIVMAYGRMYDGKIFPGVRVVGVALDGKTTVEAQRLIEDAISRSLSNGLRFTYAGTQVHLDPVIGADTPDTAHDLVGYDVQAAVQTAYGVGRDGSWISDVLDQWRLRAAPIQVPISVTIDQKNIEDAVREALRGSVALGQDARFVVRPSSTPAVIDIQPEQKGATLVMDDIFRVLHQQALNLSFSPIPLRDTQVPPSVTAADLAPLQAEAEQGARVGLQLTYDTKTVAVPTETVVRWFVASQVDGVSHIKLDPNRFATDISTVMPGIEQEAKNGTLVLKDDKIESFTAGTDGIAIDASSTMQAITASWPASSTFPLIVQKVESKLAGVDPERLGIKELLGVGKSNFSGSPVNRRKNIAHGIAMVNGTMIQPGETFSMIKTLGAIDGEHKWLPELVIKGNETKPEFGGGLCQIGTTAFRGALASGLPIVERQNHSYRVRYYEPAGTDATIYDPKPDFRFLNDTAAPILINAYSKGDEVVFEFWGTRDGRTVVQTKPRIFNIVAPPPTKTVETLDLKPGVKKCTETAHAGADAEFSYTVTYPNGEVKSEMFKSHYRPWQAVCLVGVEKLTVPTDATEAVVPLAP